MNALMLTLAVRFGGMRIQPLRVLSGAAAGAAIACAAGRLSRLHAALVWLPAAMIMMRITLGKTGRRHALAHALLLLCAAGLVGGMVLSFWGATGSLALAYGMSAIAAAGVGVCVMREKRHARDTARVRIVCTYRGKTAAFDAMIDSGNTLRDYLTHLPVIVLPERTGIEALELSNTPLRPIFAQTAGGRQKMDVLAPEKIVLEKDGRRHAVRAVIALSPQMSESVPALVPAALLGSLGI